MSETTNDDEVVILTEKTKEDKEKERDEKRKKISSGYYEIPEDKMQEIIARAQKGSGKDQEELLKIFSNFLEKYVTMLSKNRYDLRDYDIKRFINLYIASKELRFKIKNNNMNMKSYKEVNHTIKGIFYMIKRYNDEDDIRQTINMTFLECVMLYERRGEIPFSGFLYTYFFFKLKKYVDSYLIDQLGLKSYPLITDDAVSSSYETGDAAHTVSENKVPLALDVEMLIELEEIDESWVLGETCAYPFDLLSIQERQLLKWRYVDNLRPSKISEKTSDHPNTCRQNIKNIGDKVKALVEEIV